MTRRRRSNLHTKISQFRYQPKPRNQKSSKQVASNKVVFKTPNLPLLKSPPFFFLRTQNPTIKLQTLGTNSITRVSRNTQKLKGVFWLSEKHDLGIMGMGSSWFLPLLPKPHLRREESRVVVFFCEAGGNPSGV